MPDGSEQRVAEQTTSAATHPAESQESNPSSRSPAPPASTDYEEANVNRKVSDSSETDHDKHPPQDGTVGKIVGAELESGDVEGNADPNVQQQTKLQKQVSIAGVLSTTSQAFPTRETPSNQTSSLSFRSDK